MRGHNVGQGEGCLAHKARKPSRCYGVGTLRAQGHVPTCGNAGVAGPLPTIPGRACVRVRGGGDSSKTPTVNDRTSSGPGIGREITVQFPHAHTAWETQPPLPPRSMHTGVKTVHALPGLPDPLLQGRCQSLAGSGEVKARVDVVGCAGKPDADEGPQTPRVGPGDHSVGLKPVGGLPGKMLLYQSVPGPQRRVHPCGCQCLNVGV